jgi:hypothetical protein
MLRVLATAVMFVAMSCQTEVLAQNTASCLDWSPKFDRITNSKIREGVESNRQQGWANLVSQSDPQQIFDQGNQVIRELVVQIKQMQNGLRQISDGGPGDAEIYRSQIMLDEDTILAMQGTLEIARCITGYNGMIEAGAIPDPNSHAISSAPHATTDTSSLGSQYSRQDGSTNPRPSGSVSDSSLGVQDLLNTLNTPNRVQDLPGTLDTPSNVQDLLDTLSTSNNTAVSGSDVDGSWADPLLNAPDPTTEAVQIDPISGQDNGDNWQQLSSDLLKDGISNTGVTGETVVQTFDNMDGWAKLSSSSANDQITGATTILSGANDSFNTNPVSQVVTNQTMGVIDTVTQQESNFLDAMNRAIVGHASQDDSDLSLQGLQQAIIPGYTYVEALQKELAFFQKMGNGPVVKKFEEILRNLQ